MPEFYKGEEVVHIDTGEVMTVVAATDRAVLVDRATGQWTFPPYMLEPREIACPIPRPPHQLDRSVGA